ncbi:hypothetical protein HK099_008352, partial [Clydaea vesicula]
MNEISIVGRSLLITLIIDFGIQTLFYVGSAISKSELVYDLSGMLTYIACILTALLLRAQAVGNDVSRLHLRQIIAAILVLIWTIRLGLMLFLRILRTGEDKRFETLKQNRIKFFIPWFLQAVWIYLTPFPVYIILGNPSNLQNALNYSDFVGLVILVFGFFVEVLADYQKNKFKKEYPKDFIKTGIWKYSRYANYNGEITFWLGMFIFCANGFIEDWQWVSLISPFFVAFLIINVSGIRLLEKSQMERYGERE